MSSSLQKTATSPYIETLKTYGKPAAELALAADGLSRIAHAFQQNRAKQTVDDTTKVIPTKRKWDFLARFNLNPLQNGIIGAAEVAFAAYLYKK